MDLVKDLQSNFDVPFDELYHREKNLVQAVIEADKALKAKEQTFKNLVEHELITETEANLITHDSLLNNEHQSLFEKGLLREEARIMKQ
jgi:transcriptional regulator CtsR